MPTRNFLVAWPEARSFQELAKDFKVSQLVIARRALDLHLIDKERFYEFYNQQRTAFQTRKENKSSGGHYYNTARKRVSPTFAGHVNDAVRSGQLLYRDAFRLTGLTGKTYDTFISEYLNRG